MKKMHKNHSARYMQAWMFAFLLIVMIVTGIAVKVGLAYAAPTSDSGQPYQIRFVDQDGNPFLNDDGTEVSNMTKTLQPDKKVKTPKIKKKWLPAETKNDDQIIPAWNVPDTELTVYPGDEIWYEDYEEESQQIELTFYLVPDDRTINTNTSGVFFYDADGEEIEEYARPNCKIGKQITVPDPMPYGGKYWSLEDEDGNTKLYKKGDKYQVTEYSGEFIICESKTVTINYLYPVDQDLSDGHTPGEVFFTDNAQVGDYIILRGSPGNIVFGCTFRGWTESNDTYDGVLSAGRSVQILSSDDLEFVAYYEEDENWDPGAGDSEEMLPDGLTNDTTEKLQDDAGDGVSLTLNNNPNDKSYGGRLTKDGGTTTGFSSNTKNNIAQNGNLQSGTRKNEALTNREEDQYGRPMEGGDGDSTKPLVQDDSLFAMDIYGNAFAYPYWETDEGKRKEIVVNRLKQYKGNSWVNFIQKHPELSEAVSRFEEREYELLKDDCTDSLATARKSWHGWMDYYSDIPDSVAQTEKGDDDVWINNSDGETNRLLARIKYSNSWQGYTFYQYFYDPTYSTFSSYTFGGIGANVNTDNLELIYNQLSMKGYSEEAACAICAVIWQNTNGSFSAEYDGSNGKGLWAWNADEVTNVRSLLLQNELLGLGTETSVDEQWKDLQAQTRALDSWLLLNHHDDLNAAVGKKIVLGNTFAFQKTSNVQTAVDALCQIFRKGEDTQSDNALKLPDGKYYKDAAQLRKYASELKNALKKDSSGGYTFDSSQLKTMDCSEIRRTLCETAKSYVGKIPYIWGGKNLQTGVDCSGFTSAIYRMFGVTLADKSNMQGNGGIKVSRENARPGDLMVWGERGAEEGHVAIYLGNNMHVHASGKKTGIKISSGEDSGGKVFQGYFSFFD